MSGGSAPSITGNQSARRQHGRDARGAGDPKSDAEPEIATQGDTIACSAIPPTSRGIPSPMQRADRRMSEGAGTRWTKHRDMRTRRDFIEYIAAIGGSATAAMLALDLVEPARAAAPFALTGSGHGTRVVILGAGVAGLCAAYELGKIGYDCTILEGRMRPGGRVWTARNGDTHVESDGTTQTAAFPRGAYLNPGPARVPQHHVTMDYYRELDVPVEQFGNINMNAWYHSTKAAPGLERIRMRQAKNAIAGYTSELLAKSVAQNKLDATLTADDKARLLAFLADYGGLNKSYAYTNGDGAAGYSVLPASGDVAGTPSDPLGLLPLIRAGYGAFYHPEREIEQQLTMFQPVGGIDALPRAFAAQLPGKIRYGAVVTAIRKTSPGVTIALHERARRARIDQRGVLHLHDSVAGAAYDSPRTSARRLPHRCSASRIWIRRRSDSRSNAASGKRTTAS